MNKITMRRIIIFCISSFLIVPLLSAEPVMREKTVVSSFSTSIAHQSNDVKHNITLACGKLNGVRIGAGRTFSFNDTVGEGSAKNGYVDGAVLYQDGIVMEPGGGLCQVSSTLYNAFLLSGFSIVERHRHYQPVTYVPLGLDATIKYGKKDLKMKNVSDQDVVISVSLNNASCTILIYGASKLNNSYSLETEEDEISLPFSEEKENIRSGIEVYVYRNKLKDDNVIERFLLYKDFYPPVYIK